MISYIDWHCDTLMQAWRHKRQDIKNFPCAMADLQRLSKAGCMAQCFAIFMQPQPAHDQTDDWKYIQSLSGIFHQSCGPLMMPVCSRRDLLKNRADGILSGILTLEDGRAIDSITRLEQVFTMGIRLITLTWNYENCFGSPNSQNPSVMSCGLTDYGKDAIRRMEELGMIVDVSHLSDGGFWDVAQGIRGPFVASHSNCRALNPHPRSISDCMIRTIADHGGIVGVNFEPSFLTEDIRCRKSLTQDVVRHLRHMIRTGGLECASIGSDLDGICGQIQLGNADRIPNLFFALEEAGFSPEEIEHIAWKNAWRVLQDTLPAASFHASHSLSSF